MLANIALVNYPTEQNNKKDNNGTKTKVQLAIHRMQPSDYHGNQDISNKNKSLRKLIFLNNFLLLRTGNNHSYKKIQVSFLSSLFKILKCSF